MKTKSKLSVMNKADLAAHARSIRHDVEIPEDLEGILRDELIAICQEEQDAYIKRTQKSEAE